jgi:hypothetical protein
MVMVVIGMVVIVGMIVIMAFVRVCFLGRFGPGVILDSVSRTQRFTFRARQAPNPTATAGCRSKRYSDVWPGNTSSHGKRVCGWGQTEEPATGKKSTPEGTLLLGDHWFADVGKETWMRSFTV